MTAPLINARQYVWVSRVLGDDLNNRCHVSQLVWHIKEPSLINGHACRGKANIFSPSSTMLVEYSEWPSTNTGHLQYCHLFYLSKNVSLQFKNMDMDLFVQAGFQYYLNSIICCFFRFIIKNFAVDRSLIPESADDYRVVCYQAHFTREGNFKIRKHYMNIDNTRGNIGNCHPKTPCQQVQSRSLIIQNLV